MTYSKEQLVHIRNNQPNHLLPQEVYDKLKHYQILYRTRVGKHKIKNWDTNCGVNWSNLILPAMVLETQSHYQLQLSTVNVRSIRNKTGLFLNYILDNNIDICTVTETWLKPEDDTIRSELTIPGYKFLDVARVDLSGGGIGMLHRSSIPVTMVDFGQFSLFEVAAQKATLQLLLGLFM